MIQFSSASSSKFSGEFSKIFICPPVILHSWYRHQLKLNFIVRCAYITSKKCDLLAYTKFVHLMVQQLLLEFAFYIASSSSVLEYLCTIMFYNFIPQPKEYVPKQIYNSSFFWWMDLLFFHFNFKSKDLISMTAIICTI